MIYIIITTSINDKYGLQDSIHRENRYTECINALLMLIEHDSSFKAIIVENNGFRQTYLDKLKCDIVYTDNNTLNFKHKGVNELLDIKHVIEQYKIQDNDTVIKLTGRYKVLNSSFLILVKNNADNVNAFVKFFNVCTLEYMIDDCILGLFSIKCKFLKDFNYKCIKSPEIEFADYVRKNISKFMEINELNLECCFAGDLRIVIV